MLAYGVFLDCLLLYLLMLDPKRWKLSITLISQLPVLWLVVLLVVISLPFFIFSPIFFTLLLNLHNKSLQILCIFSYQSSVINIVSYSCFFIQFLKHAGKVYSLAKLLCHHGANLLHHVVSILRCSNLYINFSRGQYYSLGFSFFWTYSTPCCIHTIQGLSIINIVTPVHVIWLSQLSSMHQQYCFLIFFLF